MPIPQEEETALGITNPGCCSGYSYSSTVCALGANIHDAHVNGRHPTRGMGQEAIYMMTCITLSTLEDMKFILRDVIKVITSPKLEEEEYAALRFCLSLGEPGNTGAYLLLGLSPGSRYHMYLRDILLVKSDYAADSSTAPQAWHPLPFWPTMTEFR